MPTLHPSLQVTLGVDPLRPSTRSVAGSISADPLASPPPGAALVPIVDVTNKNTTVDDLRRSSARTITQGSHGFTAGTALFNNNGTWLKAKADAIATARVDGVVSGQGLAAGSFLVVSGGPVGGLSWAPNTQYYLSDATAGLLTTTPPTALTSFLVPVARGNTAGEAMVNIGEPLTLAKIPDSALENPGGGGGAPGTVQNGMVAMFPRSGMPASLPAGWIECDGTNGTTNEADVGAMAVVIKHGGTVAIPTFDIPAGSYGSSQTITITCATSGVEIKITTDGSTPSRTVGAIYTAPFIVAAGTTTVKAIAYRVPTNPTLTMIDSAIQSAVYTVSAADTTPPIVSTLVIPPAGTTLMMFFSEIVYFGAGGSAGVTLAMSGGAVTASSPSGTGTNTLTYALSRTILSGETGTVSYAQPGNGIEDGAGNDNVGFTGAALTNNSTQTADTTPPIITNAIIPPAGNVLKLFFNEIVVVGAGGAAGVTLVMSGGAVTTVSASGAGTNNLDYTLSRTILPGETGTVGYAQPGNGIEDNSPAHNDLASFASFAIINNSTAGGGGGVAIDFSTYPNGTYLGDHADWVNVSAADSLQVNSGGLVRATVAADHSVRHTAVLNADQYAETEVAVTYDGGQGIGPIVRASDSANSYYGLMLYNGTFYLTRYLAGIKTTLDSSSDLTTTIPDSSVVKVRLQVTGTGSATRLTSSYSINGGAYVPLSTNLDPGGTYLDGGFAGAMGYGTITTAYDMTDFRSGDV